MNAVAAYVTYRREGRVALITLQRPAALNAFSFQMIREIRDASRLAETDPEVTAIVITGTGRAFSSGFDASTLLKITKDSELEEKVSRPGEIPALFSFFLEVSKPVIAAINGVAAGGGLVLALMCDLRFAVQSASFTTIFAKRGLIAEHATSWMLPRIVGPSRALDLLWSSRKVGAEEAYRIGLVDRVVPDSELMAEVDAYVDGLATNVSAAAMATIKAQVYRDLSDELGAAARRADELKRISFGHPDAREGALAFVERRSPRFAPWQGPAQ